MKTEDIKKMAQAWLQVQEASKKKMDPVDHDELKGTHAQRKDKDINNDGKSDKTDEYLHRRRKAVSAAIKGKKKDQEVEVQTSEATVNELSKKTLGSYIKKASDDKADNAYNLGAKDPLGKKGSWRKSINRRKGIEKATDKLTKEEAEQIDELKKSTLSSYVKKASGNMAGNTAVAAAQASSSMKKSSPDVKRNIKNRMKGISRAADKLAKEEVELDEVNKSELGKHIGTVNGYHIHDLGKNYPHKAKRFVAAEHDYGWLSHTGSTAKEVKDRARSLETSGSPKPKSRAEKDHDEWREKQKHRIKSGEVRKAVMSRRGVKEEVELDEGIEKMSHARLKWHMNTGVPHGSYSKDEMKAERDRRLSKVDTHAAYKKAKPSMNEAATATHKPNNGSPAGEGLSPSAKKELAKKTPAPAAFDVDTVNKKTFDAIRASAKKSPMRTNDNATGDKTMPKNDGK